MYTYFLPGKLPATFVLSSIAANPVNTLPPPDYTPFTFFGAMFAVWMHMDDTATCTHWRPEVIPFRCTKDIQVFITCVWLAQRTLHSRCV